MNILKSVNFAMGKQPSIVPSLRDNNYKDFDVVPFGLIYANILGSAILYI